MTLILNLINREHAIQVSDRCFTWFREDGAVEHTEDEHSKAVVFKDRLVLSYTGLGVQIVQVRLPQPRRASRSQRARRTSP